MLTDQDIDRIAEAVAERLKEDAVITHILEHEATGAGRVIDAAKAKATPCKCFTYDSDMYAWSPGVLGLISSKKNPEQYREFCALGCIPAGAGAEERFRKIKGAIGEAHKEWEAKGGDLKEWWEIVGKKMEEKRIEL